MLKVNAERHSFFDYKIEKPKFKGDTYTAYFLADFTSVSSAKVVKNG